MKTSLMKAHVWTQFWRDEDGQDIVEYVLVVALIALAATLGMGPFANKINDAFASIGSKLVTYTS